MKIMLTGNWTAVDSKNWRLPPYALKRCMQAACKDAGVLPHLLATVQQSQSPEVQLLAAQTLRRHIPRDWRRLSSQVRPPTTAARRITLCVPITPGAPCSILPA